MIFQTSNNSENNRDKKGLERLKKLLCPIWLGRQDSNLRMLVPKTSALPLGDAPSLTD